MTGTQPRYEPSLPAQSSPETLLPHGARVALRSSSLGIDLSTIWQDSTESAESVEWSFASPEHTVMVWRRGTVHSKEVEFANGVGAEVTPQAGNLWIVPAGQRATGVALGSGYEYQNLTVPASVIGDWALDPVVNRRDPIVFALIERIASTAGRSDVVARLLRESLVDTLRLHLLDTYGAEPVARQVQQGVFDLTVRQTLIDYLNDALDTAVDLPTLAGLVGMSVSAFRRAFAETFYTTPHQFVLDLRIGKAKSLLTSTTLTMTEISAIAGFSSPSHFASTFKQRVGESPTAYRAGTG